METKSTLLEQERAFWRAAGDRDRYASGLTDDAVHVLPGLGVADRGSVLDGVGAASPWDAFALEQPELLRVGDGAAALVYTARATRDGVGTYVAAVTSVYRRTPDGWKLVVHQQTPLGPG